MISYRWDGYSTKCAEGEVSVQYPLSLWYSGDKILIMKVNMMVQRFIAMLLMVVLVGLVRAEMALIFFQYCRKDQTIIKEV